MSWYKGMLVEVNGDRGRVRELIFRSNKFVVEFAGCFRVLDIEKCKRVEEDVVKVKKPDESFGRLVFEVFAHVFKL